MKTLKLIIVGIFFLVSSAGQSQVSINVNIGTPPLWGPVGYSNVDFYYLPDIQMYYDIRATQYIYFSNGKWCRSRNLPNSHRNYDLYNGYKVVLKDYHGSKPYVYFNEHKVKYHKGYKGNPQKTIGRNPNYQGNNGNGHYEKGNDDYEYHENHGNNGHHGNGNNGHGKGHH